MSRASYSGGKRQREADKARKKQEKAERRQERKERGGDGPDIISAEEAAGAMPSIEEAMRAIESQGVAPREAAAIPARLFVGSLSWDTDEASLAAAFEPFGPLAEVVVVTDRDTGRSRGFGFVVMANRKDAAKAIEALDGSTLDGRTIVVNVATERR